MITPRSAFSYFSVIASARDNGGGTLRNKASRLPRDRLVEDWEIDEALAIESSYRGVLIANAYMRLKLMTGLRRGDILRLKLSNLKEDGIHVLLNKTEHWKATDNRVGQGR